MKQLISTGAAVLGMLLLFGVAINWSFGGGLRMAPNYERVRIVERTDHTNGTSSLLVRLTGQNEVSVELEADDALHAEAQYVCVGIFGDPENASTKATYADLSNCPLPVSRTLPMSGRTERFGSGTVTTRTLSINGASGTPAGQFQKSNLGFSGNK